MVDEDIYTGIDAQHDPEFILEGYTEGELREMQLRQSLQDYDMFNDN